MSKHNNVNPDHYKTGGRERPGNPVAKAPQQPEAVNRETKERWLKREKKARGKPRGPRNANE